MKYLMWLECKGVINCHYFSNALQTNVEINVILPTPEENEQITDKGEGSRYDYENGLPVIGSKKCG